MNNKRAQITGVILALCLLASLCLNAHLLNSDGGSYMQAPGQIYTLETGILLNSLEWRA